MQFGNPYGGVAGEFGVELRNQQISAFETEILELHNREEAEDNFQN